MTTILAIFAVVGLLFAAIWVALLVVCMILYVCEFVGKKLGIKTLIIFANKVENWIDNARLFKIYTYASSEHHNSWSSSSSSSSSSSWGRSGGSRGSATGRTF